MLQCQCRWINATGKETPDHNEAIAMTACYNPMSFGEKGSAPFPICLEHAMQKSQFWKLLPLPNQKEEDWHPLVKDDKYFRVIPDAVANAIKIAFPKDAAEIFRTLRHSTDHWSFFRWGMYVGVEYDGHIHT